MQFLIVFLASMALCHGELSHVFQPPFNRDQYDTSANQGSDAYSFEYKAGRHPGHVDRVHSETGDGSGHAKGTYSYIDPKSKVRTVQYIVDENGHHPSLTNYNQGYGAHNGYQAARNANERHRGFYNDYTAYNGQTPMDTPSVARAKDLHRYLFEKIAAEHLAVAAGRANANFY